VSIKNSDDKFHGRSYNNIIIFFQGDYRKGQFVMVKIADATAKL
jgi:tRNA A37 methylthiotransferase MiaB